MRTHDKDDLELQVAAVKLWYEGREEERTQEEVAGSLRAMYPLRGQFDKYRVNRLCQYAVDNKLAERPTPARLKDTQVVRSELAKVVEAEQYPDVKVPLENCLDRLCASGWLKERPELIIVSGSVERSPGDQVSQFAVSAAMRAIAQLRSWQIARKQPVRVGVTWGRQVHSIALAANTALTKEATREGKYIFVPLLGLPIGEHRSDTLSSSEIAKLLNGRAFTNAHGGEYDLQLVPAYFPESNFSDAELPSLYKLLFMVEGWRKIFGASYQVAEADLPQRDIGDIGKCDFIWSSISDIGEPFGMSASGQNRWTPFAALAGTRSAAAPLPVADCGGIPLWADHQNGDADRLEATFRLRWTGIRREHWRDCVERGLRNARRAFGTSGAVVFAPNDRKAGSVVHALRDGLVNTLVLGLPCARRLVRLLEERAPAKG